MHQTQNRAGFSLVELMVVVAIVGILSAIGTSSYQKFVRKARQAEAKSALSAIYTTEMIWRSQWSTFTYCLYPAGYEPQPEGQRYYASGFLGGGVLGSPQTTNYSAGGVDCDFGRIAWGGPFPSWRNDGVFTMNTQANANMAGQSPPGNLYVVPSTSQFRAVAFGSINPSLDIFDVWSIDQNKNLVNDQPGL